MPAAPGLIVLVAPAIDQPVLLALTAGASETIMPVRLLHAGFAILLSDEKWVNLDSDRPA